MNIKIKWLAALAALAFSVCATPAAHAGLLGLSEEDEIEAGRQVAQQALREYGGAMPANHAYTRRVKAIGAQFARLSTRKGITYSYTVLNDNKVLNAFAAPGGPVFVTRKLVETAANDAELAYVLGHETAHIEKKHIVKQVEQQQKAGLIVGILGAIIGRGRNNNTVGTLANVGWAVLSRGYSRQDENEADAVGVRFMSQLGYDPRAAITMLGKLDSGGRSGGVDKYLATHPAPKDRQERVRGQIEKEKLVDVARRNGGPRMSAGFDSGNGYATVSGNLYPGEGSAYPPASGAGAYYPPDSADGEIDLGAPVRLHAIGNTGNGAVVVPVSGFARWAGAALTVRGALLTMRGSGATLELRQNSTRATLNGASQTLSVPVTLHNGYWYAPLSQLARAAGVQATMNPAGRTVRLSRNGRPAGFLRLP